MKISVNFDSLVSLLGYANTVLGDKSVDEKMKNFIFMVTPDSTEIIAYSAYTFVRSDIEDVVNVDLAGKSKWLFQVKASEVNKIVASFSNLSKTKVTQMDFEESGVRIKVTVHEEPKDEANVRLAQDSEYFLENAPIIKMIEEEIQMKFPEEAEMIASGDLLLYLDSLFGLVNNDTANSIASKINFVDEYVFVISSSYSAFMVNKLPEAFKDISVTYSSVNFLKKLTEKSETILVAKSDKYLCIQDGGTDAFIKLQKVKVKHQMYTEKRSKEKGIVIDRLYFKDVLKRLGNVEVNATMKVVGDELHVSNSNFNQVIPLVNTKEAEGISFQVSIPVLEKIILGKDDVFGFDLFMYFVPTLRGYIIFLSDKTGAWFTNTQVVGVQ